MINWLGISGATLYLLTVVSVRTIKINSKHVGQEHSGYHHRLIKI